MRQSSQPVGGAGVLVSGPVQVALWLIVVLLAVNAAVLLLRSDSSPAWAQQPAPGAARRDASGVFVVPGQIDKELWGVYLIDTRASSIVLYQYNPNSRKLKLAAARTFIYDRYLENYNTDPSPAEIAELISKARPIRPAPPAGQPRGPGGEP